MFTVLSCYYNCLACFGGFLIMNHICVGWMLCSCETASRGNSFRWNCFMEGGVLHMDGEILIFVKTSFSVFVANSDGGSSSVSAATLNLRPSLWWKYTSKLKIYFQALGPWSPFSQMNENQMSVSIRSILLLHFLMFINSRAGWRYFNLNVSRD